MSAKLRKVDCGLAPWNGLSPITRQCYLLVDSRLVIHLRLSSCMGRQTVPLADIDCTSIHCL